MDGGWIRVSFMCNGRKLQLKVNLLTQTLNVCYIYVHFVIFFMVHAGIHICIYTMSVWVGTRVFSHMFSTRKVGGFVDALFNWLVASFSGLIWGKK